MLIAIIIDFVPEISTSISFAEITKNELCNKVSEENPIFITTNLEQYERGDSLLAEGCVDSIAHFKGINVLIYDPDGCVVTGGSVVPNPDGTFSREFVLMKNHFQLMELIQLQLMQMVNIMHQILLWFQSLAR